VTILTTYLQFGNGGILVEIVRIVDYKFTPYMAIHARSHKRAGKTQWVLFVSRRESPPFRVLILDARVVGERRFKKVIPPSYTISNTCHWLSQSKDNPFGLLREFRTIWARLELAHIVFVILTKYTEAMVGILLANSSPCCRQVPKLGTLAGKSGCLAMGSSHVILVDFQVARSTGFGAHKSNFAGEIAVNNVLLLFGGRFGWGWEYG